MMKRVARRVISRRNSKINTVEDGATSFLELNRELKQPAVSHGRLPPEAIADVALTRVRLTRRTVPDEDVERTLLKWLSRRGFHDVLALQTTHQRNGTIAKLTRKKSGLDLCLWVGPERLLRTAISKDPRKRPRHPRDLTREERASLVQASVDVLKEAKEMKILSYDDMFLLHDKEALDQIVKLQRSWKAWWDSGDTLLDATAAYFGTKIGYYFAWLRFCTSALVFPTIFGLYLWWSEKSLFHGASACVQGTAATESSNEEPGNTLGLELATATYPPRESPMETWWGPAVSVMSSSVAYSLEAVSLPVSSTSGPHCSWGNSLTPYFNLFLAVWATLLLVFWKRRSNTLAFRWG
ncbi:unnamed protein product, partial [Discosporangium mesarthrocarpum]